MCNYSLGDKLVVTDTDRIAVVLDAKGKDVVFARRIHSETCGFYAAELRREEMRKEKAAWEKQQQRRGSNRTRGM